MRAHDGELPGLDKEGSLCYNVGGWSPKLRKKGRWMPRYKEAEREEALRETRRLLLEAATEEFGREGYARANINRISKAAGFAKGTIYNYFDSKRALMLALIDEIAAAHVGYVGEQVLQAKEAVGRLGRFFEAGFAWVTDNLARGRVLISMLYGPDAGFREHMYRAYEPMFRLVAEEILVPGMREGVFREVDPVDTSRLLMTLYLGVTSQPDDKGRMWFEPGEIAAFALHGLLSEGRARDREAGRQIIV
jgi:TetR/AcrR family fatty acid metabolism transcriptional regulator